MSKEIIKEINLRKMKELTNLAERYLGYDSLHVWNVNINGILIQLRTNDSTLDNFGKKIGIQQPTITISDHTE